MSDQEKKYNYSWAFIIILLIVFWPVGLVLLFLKLTDGKLGQDNEQNNNGGGGRTPISPIINSVYPKRTGSTSPRSTTCTGCGAPNTITNTYNPVCEYCGKSLLTNKDQSNKP